MSASLIDRIRKEREFDVAVGGWTFRVRRPTDYEIGLLRGDAAHPLRICARFVIGWSLLERDVVVGGDAGPVPYTPELGEAWLEDHAQVWQPIVDALVAAYNAHAEALGEAGGK